jgi:polysaccharide biosynthesis/export protein
MLKNLSGTNAGKPHNSARLMWAGLVRPALVSAILLIAAIGCQSPQTGTFGQLAAQPTQPKSDIIILHEGDSVRISFPGAPNLNVIQQIRRDGRLTLPLVGEFKAAGLTPSDMEKELVKLYEPQLQTKEVNVAVESSAFPIYVTGAVLRPGRINADRPLTALEAIMEAGIDYNRANLKSVRVIRTENSKTENHVMNLKQVLQGKSSDQFKLKPQDIIFVPEKFSWF